jgi:hypothetical protein
MEFWAALCIAGGAAIGALAFAFCLLKLLICYESHQRLQWADMIRERRETSERLWATVVSERLNKTPVASAEARKAKTVCITDPTVQIAIARAPRPAWPDQLDPADWVVVIQPSESESA